MARRQHTLRAPSYDDIVEARIRLKTRARRTPLVPLNGRPCFDSDGEKVNIFLKLENLQDIGSFKIRAAGNAFDSLDMDQITSAGISTASAGNFGQGLAYVCREQGVSLTVVVPDHTPVTKLQGMRRLGANIVKVSFVEWVRIYSILLPICTSRMSVFCSDRTQQQVSSLLRSARIGPFFCVTPERSGNAFLATKRLKFQERYLYTRAPKLLFLPETRVLRWKLLRISPKWTPFSYHTEAGRLRQESHVASRRLQDRRARICRAGSSR